MELQKKKNAAVYAVVEPSWFSQYTETISQDFDNADIYWFFIEQVKGTRIENEYKAWLKEHETDYYFSVQKDKTTDECYAVASCRDGIVSYAIELNINYIL